jgi:hypothetical protein
MRRRQLRKNTHYAARAENPGGKMRFGRIHSFVVLGGVALSAAGSAAQGPSLVALGSGPMTAQQPFSDISGLHELPDGRALVGDRRERGIQLVDFERGTASPVSREGSGPLEYRTPGRFFRWRGDSVVMYDPGLTRMLVVDPTGVPRRSLDLIQALSFVIEGQRPSRGDIRFIDASGKVYTQSSVIPVVAAGNAPPDSGPVVRYDLERRRVDTLALVRLSDLTYRPGVGVSWSDLANPYRMQDAWTALPDGRVALVRSAPYRVEWLDTPGGHTRGAVIPTTPIRVAGADREAIARAGVTIGGRPTLIPIERLTGLPATKPAFDHRTLIADPVTSTIWVQRFRHAADSMAVYDVFDVSGRLRDRVRVPPRSRVVGFGHAHVYVARTDDDDLQWLERFRRP